MKRIILLALMFSANVFAQTSNTTTTTSQDTNSRTETTTKTETQLTNGKTITTTTTTSTPNMDAYFGIKAGANWSDFIVRNMPDAESNLGFGGSAGVFLKLESKHFALQYDLTFHYKKSKMDDMLAVEDMIMEITTDYRYYGLELAMYPILQGLYDTLGGKVFIGAGPYLGLGLDAIQKPGNIDLYKKDKDSNKSIMGRLDFGLGIIAGMEFKNVPNGLVYFGYQVGLINLLSAEKDAKTMKNRHISFGFGYKF